MHSHQHTKAFSVYLLLSFVTYTSFPNMSFMLISMGFHSASGLLSTLSLFCSFVWFCSLLNLENRVAILEIKSQSSLCCFVCWKIVCIFLNIKTQQTQKSKSLLIRTTGYAWETNSCATSVAYDLSLTAHWKLDDSFTYQIIHSGDTDMVHKWV